jgi:hypothetical protein
MLTTAKNIGSLLINLAYLLMGAIKCDMLMVREKNRLSFEILLSLFECLLREELQGFLYNFIFSQAASSLLAGGEP